jgi:hypothetical protein
MRLYFGAVIVQMRMEKAVLLLRDGFLTEYAFEKKG